MALRFYDSEVLSLTAETPDAYTIRFANPDPEAFQYLAGQYVTLKVQVDGKEERRAFSFSSSPTHDDHLSVTIKAIPDGRVSPYLKQTLKPGDTLSIFPPQGRFTLTPQPEVAKHHVLLGAGSGITPLMSMLKTALTQEPNSHVTLLYSNRTYEDIIFREELKQWKAQYPNRLHVTHLLSRPGNDWQGPSGRLEGDFCANLVKQAIHQVPLKPTYYMCGPTGMMESVNDVLLNRMQVPEASINREWYSAPVTAHEATVSADGSVAETAYDEYEIKEQTIKVKLDGFTLDVTVQPDQYILDAIIDAGYDPPYACQEGVCCTCRAKLKAGQVAMDEREGLSDEELEQGFILTCQSHPITEDVDVEFA